MADRTLEMLALGMFSQSLAFDHPEWVDPLPDYSQSNGSTILEDAWFEAVDVNRKSCFYRGALTVLKLLSTPETMPHEDMVKLARSLTHECRHGLMEEKRDPGF